MKLSGAQQRLHEALRAAPDGKYHAGSGGHFKRTTAEALARRGLVWVERRISERTVRHRTGAAATVTTIDWTAHLRVVTPGQEELAELDLILERAERTLRPEQREHAAAYIAAMRPILARENAPVRAPDYDETAEYARFLHMEPGMLLASYMAVRSSAVDLKLPASPHEGQGALTDTWVATEPGTPAEPGRELGRVRGATMLDARMAANSLLARRGGYSLRRLGTEEIGPWIKDFRVGEAVLRLASDTEHEFVVSQVATGRVLVIRANARDAEREARDRRTSLLSVLEP